MAAAFAYRMPAKFRKADLRGKKNCGAPFAPGANAAKIREFFANSRRLGARNHDCFLSSVPSPFLTRRAIFAATRGRLSPAAEKFWQCAKEATSKKIVFLSAWTLDSISAARSGQIYWKDEPGDEESTQDSNDTIADVIEIRIGCGALEDAVEKSERNLQPGITRSLHSACQRLDYWSAEKLVASM